MTTQTDPIESKLRDAVRAKVAPAARRAAGRVAQRAADDGLVDVAYTSFETPLGTTVLAATEQGLVRIGLPNQPLDEVLAELSIAVSPRVLEWRSRLDPALRELDEYFAGHRRRFELALDWRLARGPFMRRVLDQTARVPFGSTTTYAAVAAKAGSPRAHRAAGNALGANPIPIVVPCHRVLRSGGGLGGYGGGLAMKEELLRREGVLS